jgi:hypothetical protein
MKALQAAIDQPATPPVFQARRELSYGLLPLILGYHLRRTQVAIFRHFSGTVSTIEDLTPGLFGMLQVIAANPGLGQSRRRRWKSTARSSSRWSTSWRDAV